MNEEKIVYTLAHNISLPELFAFLSYKEHKVVKSINMFNVPFADNSSLNNVGFNHKELVLKYH